MVRNNKVLSFDKVMKKGFAFTPQSDKTLIPLLYREYIIALSVFCEERNSRKFINFKKYVSRNSRKFINFKKYVSRNK
jgi:hypothetical protein